MQVNATYNLDFMLENTSSVKYGIGDRSNSYA